MTSSELICRRKLPVTKYIISCTIEWADVSYICEIQGICLQCKIPKNVVYVELIQVVPGPVRSDVLWPW